jgi:hypothetical protein
MNSERERKLGLSDPGRDAPGDELERILEDAEPTVENATAEDAGCDSFLERFPPDPRKRRPAN